MANKAKMQARQAGLSHGRLTEVLSYDPVTGIFLWKKRISIRIVVGKVAGVTDRHGHRIIRIDGTKFMAHRLAWFYTHREWPEDQIEHRDLNKDNNSISNLRASNQTQNMWNTGKFCTNTSGYKGVSTHASGGYVAQISRNNRTRYLGYFKDPLEAHKVYVEAVEKERGEFGRVA